MFQKVLPFFISLIHSTILVVKRRLILTFDDVVCLIVFIISFSLYQTYESSAAALKGRFFQPFLYTERSKMHQLKPVGFTKDGVPIYTDTPNPPYVKLTKDDIKRRQRIIDEAMKKREKDHEEYMR